MRIDETVMDGIRECSEGIAGVGRGVMYGHGGECAGWAGVGDVIVFERIDPRWISATCTVSKLGTAGVDDGGLQEFSRVVDGGPDIVCSRHEDGGVAGGADGLLEGVELEVASCSIVREDAGCGSGPAGIMLAHDVEVVRDGLVCGGVVVEQEPFAVAGRLHPPDGHVVCDADIPGCEDGEVWVGLELCLEVTTLHEVEELGGVDGAVGEVVEGFLGGGWVFLFDEGAQGAALAEIPRLLGIGELITDARFELLEVFLLVGGGFRLPAREFVFGVFIPRKEVELGVEGSEGVADAGHGFFHHFVVGAGLSTFVSRLEEDEAFQADGFLTA